MDLASIRLVVLGNSKIMLPAVGQIEGTELLLHRLAKTKTNKEFLAGIAKAMEIEKSQLIAECVVDRWHEKG